MRKIIFIVGVPLILLASSCKKSLPDYGQTATTAISNGWWVILYNGGVAQTKHVFLATYNTSSNSKDSIWVDARKHFTNTFAVDKVSFKCKAVVDASGVNFSATSAVNAEYTGSSTYPATATITGGKIILKGGKSPTGVITDSIYMQATFPNHPGVTYTIAGVARTGFEDDDY